MINKAGGFNSSVCCCSAPGAFPAIPGHVPEGQCEGGGLQIHHGSLHKVGPLKNSHNNKNGVPLGECDSC